MEKFEVNILGCGSALPTSRHFPTSQVVNMRDKLFMIDCGEGTQMQFRKQKLKFSRLNHIFISHLHGDHCFGLLGLISTLTLLGRTAELHIYSPKGMEALFSPMLDFFNNQSTYQVVFHEFDTRTSFMIFEDRSMTVETIPLRHRLPCCGFLFKEKPLPQRINKEQIDYYQVPVYELNRIKNGEDYVTPEGDVIANHLLTFPADAPRSYAYCSDTSYLPQNVELLKGVDLLFHEATFLESELKRAEQTRHSTAKQAAMIAKQAEVKRLLIGHYSARYEDEQLFLKEAQEIFPNVVLAKEHLTISV